MLRHPAASFHACVLGSALGTNRQALERATWVTHRGCLSELNDVAVVCAHNDALVLWRVVDRPVGAHNSMIQNFLVSLALDAANRQE